MELKLLRHFVVYICIAWMLLRTFILVLFAAEYKLGRDWVAKNLTLARDMDVQLFEVVIRILGGFLSIYHLSEDQMFLHKAVSRISSLVCPPMLCFETCLL